MSSLKINKVQLASLQKKIKQLKTKSEQELSNELGRIALESARTAKKKVAKDDSILVNSIHGGLQDSNTASVVATAKYAPYIEFGTGDKVNLKDMQELGIPDSYAWGFKGAKDGYIGAQPYFFGSVREEFAKGIVRINKTLKKLSE